MDSARDGHQLLNFIGFFAETLAMECRSLFVFFAMITIAALIPSMGRSDEGLRCYCNNGVDPLRLEAQMDRFVDLNVRLNDEFAKDAFATQDGHAFLRTPNQIESYKLRTDMKNSLRALNCIDFGPESLLSGTFVMRVDTESILTPSLSKDYMRAQVQYFSNFKTAAEYKDFIRSTSVADLVSGSTMTQAEATALKIIFKPEGVSLEKAAAPFKSKLTQDEKIQVALAISSVAVPRYAKDKFGSGTRIPVSNDQVLLAGQDSIIQSGTGEDQPLTAGDCSDIANAQGALLKALGGFKNIHVVTSTNDDSPHTTVVAQYTGLSGQPKKWVRMNYWTASTTNGPVEGGELLRMPASTEKRLVDIGPGYHISQVNGRTVAYVPSTFGNIQREASGMRSNEPMARSSSSLTGVQLALSGNRSVNLFAGRDKAGDLFGGVSFHQDYLQKSHFPGSVGVVADTRSVVVPGSTANMTVSDLYVQLEQEVRTSDIEVAKDVKARLDASLIALISYGYGFGGSPKSHHLSIGPGVFANVGAQFTAGDEYSKASGRVRIDAQFAPGLENMGGLSLTAYLNHLMFSAEGRVKLSQTTMGRAYLTAATGILLDYFGPRVFARLGLETPKAGFRVEVLGRLFDETPTFKDGTLRRGTASLGINATDFLRISLMGQTIIEGPDSTGNFGLGFDGKF